MLVIGGASSGKSTVALALASRGLLRRQPKAFVATAQALDLEMAAKIRRHQSSRDGSWTTADVPIDMVGWFQKLSRDEVLATIVSLVAAVPGPRPSGELPHHQL